MAVSVYARTLLKAAELLGGRKKLMRLLQVPMSELDKWIVGEAVPPTPVFLKAVDVVLDETSAAADDPGRSESGLEKKEGAGEADPFLNC